MSDRNKEKRKKGERGWRKIHLLETLAGSKVGEIIVPLFREWEEDRLSLVDGRLLHHLVQGNGIPTNQLLDQVVHIHNNIPNSRTDKVIIKTDKGRTQ